MDCLNIFNEISNTLELGVLVEPVNSVSGGYKHKMYYMKTTGGMYAIKLLDPTFMKMERSLVELAEAEEIECILEKTNIPIVPALIFNEQKMQRINGQYYYIFNWVVGKILTPEEVNDGHCKTIGTILAKIHKINKFNTPKTISYVKSNWDNYILLSSKKCQEISNMLYDNKELLYNIQEKANIAINSLPPISAISHSDLKFNNIIWEGKNPWIIDLEALCYENPYVGLFRLAMQWSGYLCGNHKANIKLLKVFLQAYIKEYSEFEVDWEILYDSNLSMIEWLEYCIKSVLTDTNDVNNGKSIKKIRQPIESLVYYDSIKQEVLAELNTL